MKDVTVIIPCYNMPTSAIEAIQSALAQDCNVAVLIVDDGSIPPLELPKQLESMKSVRLLRHGENRGAGAARNTAIEACKTKWIAFLDADDVLVKNTLGLRLEEAKKYLATQSEPDSKALTLFSCGWRELSNSGDDLFVRTPLPATSAEEFASGCWWNPGSTTLARREVFVGDGGAYEGRLKRLEDYEWGVRFGLRGGRLQVQQFVGAVVKPSLSSNLTAVSSSVAHIRSLHGGLVSSNPRIWRHLNAYLELELSTFSIRAGKYFSAGGHLFGSYWYKPRLRRHFSPGWMFKRPHI